MKSNRIQDHHAESELAKYLDNHIYPTFFNFLQSKGFSSIKGERVYIKEEQLKGIDYKISFVYMDKVGTFKIDEKAQLYYMENPLPTFAFEIDSLQKGFITPGWLFNDSLETNFYMLIYPKSKELDLHNITQNDFFDVECIFLSKSKLITKLNKIGYTSDYCLNTANLIRNNRLPYNKDTGTSYKYYSNLNDKISLSYTYSLLEHPINLVIKKDFLKELAFYSCKS